jgi:hypothetical protein
VSTGRKTGTSHEGQNNQGASQPTPPAWHWGNINIFWSVTQARVVIADWKEEYNYHRRHSALGYQTPAN